MTKVDCLSDIATVVSQAAAMNHPQLVGDESGNVIVPWYDWATFFEEHVVKSALKETITSGFLLRSLEQ